MIDCVDGGFLPDGVFDQLPMPSQIGAIRVGCGDVKKGPTRNTLTAVLAAVSADGFRPSPISSGRCDH